MQTQELPNIRMDGDIPGIPRRPIQRWVRPLARFLKVESSGGIVLLVCTAVALFLANSQWAEDYHAFWETVVGVQIGGLQVFEPLHFWINDALMTIFFFVVGLEIKREIIAGELSQWRKAALPVMAAIGGMVVPASIYLALQGDTPAARGWGVPMATDIAFVVGVMALLGSRVPLGLRIMLLALAIADDIGAILVIAFAYSDPSWTPLMYGISGFAVCYFFNRIGVRAVAIYVLVGAGIWYFFHEAHVHPTVAGVMLGLMTPASAWLGNATLRDVLLESLRRIQSNEMDPDPPGQPHPHTMGTLANTARESVSPLEWLETGLHPWVSFVIMPVFALANAGVTFDMGVFQSNPAALDVSIAIACGLFLGKPIGVLLFSWAAVRLDIAALPRGVTWPVLLGGGMLAGIGFTMALFVANLAYINDLQGLLDAGKIGILVGSLLSALVGTLVLLTFLPKQPPSNGEENGNRNGGDELDSRSRT